MSRDAFLSQIESLSLIRPEFYLEPYYTSTHHRLHIMSPDHVYYIVYHLPHKHHRTTSNNNPTTHFSFKSERFVCQLQHHSLTDGELIFDVEHIENRYFLAISDYPSNEYASKIELIPEEDMSNILDIMSVTTMDLSYGTLTGSREQLIQWLFLESKEDIQYCKLSIPKNNELTITGYNSSDEQTILIHRYHLPTVLKNQSDLAHSYVDLKKITPFLIDSINKYTIRWSLQRPFEFEVGDMLIYIAPHIWSQEKEPKEVNETHKNTELQISSSVGLGPSPSDNSSENPSPSPSPSDNSSDNSSPSPLDTAPITPRKRSSCSSSTKQQNANISKKTKLEIFTTTDTNDVKQPTSLPVPSFLPPVPTPPILFWE